jgi:glycosyltransferase involved in cell wall biosynthesis
MRARHLGWRHVGLPGLFVGHVGGRSFGTAKAHLITRNLEVMERLHPGYAALIAGWCASDPMAVHRRAIDAARFTAAAHAEAVVLLTHGREGGVLRRVEERAAALRAEGLRPVVLRPAEEEGRRFCMVSEGVGAAHPNLRFAMPEELPALLDLLRAARVRLVELHHFLGHDPALLDLPAQLGVPSEAVLHDYAWFCPRINLVSGGHYCGEPDLATCETCVRDHGATIEEEIRPTVLVARSTRVLGAARRVITPSADTARRYRRHLPRLRPEKLAWEDDAALPPLIVRPPGPMLKVAVVGAIGIEKGFDLLLGCAREAAGRRRPLRFAVIGHTCDDDRLLEVGNVTITGPYAEHEAAALIEAEAADLAFLPSIWPETWCYTLTTAWQGGLAVLAFDIGAPAERIRATGRGWVLPLGASPAMVNDGLFAAWRQMQASASAAERGAAARGTEAGGTAPQGAVA